MRYLPTAFALLAACGGSNSSSNNGDANGGGDGNNGGGDSLSGNPTTVTVTLTNRPDNAAMYTFLAAYQDGAAAWTLAPAPSGDTYSFTVNSPVWGFAWTCIVPGSTIARVELAYFTAAEKTSLTESIPVGCTDRVMNVGLSGNVSNLNNGGNGFRAAFGTNTRGVMTNGNFSLEAPAGTRDLFISHGSGTGGFGPVDAVARQSATAPMTGVAVDWNNSAATVQTGVTAPGAGVSTTLYTASGTALNLGTAGGNGGGSLFVTGLDASQQVAGDLYAMAATFRAQGSSETVEIWASTTGAQTYTDPAPLGGATSTVPTTMPYPEILTTWSAYANAIGYLWDARQGLGTSFVPPLEWTAIVGPGYVGSTPKFQTPDLSMLTGWSTTFEFQTGQQVVGSASALTSTAGTADFPIVNPATAGTQRVLAASGWTVTP